jgi:iron complex transport system substrate-binding protein
MKKIFLGCLVFFAAAGARGESPKRIISLMPSNTEILYALGAQDQLVGVTRYCDYPPEAKQKEQIGDFLHPNFEKIISLHPDLVLAGDWQTSRIVPRLRKSGIRVVEIKLPATVEAMLGTIDEIARITGREKEGLALVGDLRRRVDALAARAKRLKKQPKVYVEIDPPSWTVSDKSFISDALKICGAQNIFADLSASGAQVSSEAILQADPDLIVLFSTNREEVLRRAGWSRISAVRNRRILDKFTRLYLNRPTPSLIKGMEIFSEKLTELGFE